VTVLFRGRFFAITITIITIIAFICAQNESAAAARKTQQPAKKKRRPPSATAFQMRK
jgi:hypothetical protein